MKKKSAKKHAKAQRPSKKRMTPIQELQQRNMRLTQEFDRLSTKVESQGNLLFRIHQMLQTEMMMPYEVAMQVTVPMVKAGDEKKSAQPVKGFSVASPGPGKSVAHFSSGKGEVKYYTACVKSQETLLGHLSTNGDWTFDPALIRKFETKELLVSLLENTKVPDGAKVKIEAHRQ